MIAAVSLGCGPPVTRLHVPVGSGDTLEAGSARACSQPAVPGFAFETWHGDALHWRARAPGVARIVCSTRVLVVAAHAPTALRIEGARAIRVGEVLELGARLAAAHGPLESPRHVDVTWETEGAVALKGGRCEFPPWCTCGGFYGTQCVRATRPGSARVRATHDHLTTTVELTVAP